MTITAAERPASEIVSSLILPSADTQNVPGNYTLTVKNPGFIAAIKNRQKTVDARISERRLERIAPGSLLTFRSWQRSVTCVVTGKASYPNIQALLKAEGVAKCFPPQQDVASGVKVFSDFPSKVTNPTQRRVIAIRFEVYNSSREPAVLKFL